MFWALVLMLTTGPQTQEFVIDQFRTSGDCFAALRTLKANHYHETHVTFACEKTRVEKKRG